MTKAAKLSDKGKRARKIVVRAVNEMIRSGTIDVSSGVRWKGGRHVEEIDLSGTPAVVCLTPAGHQITITVIIDPTELGRRHIGAALIGSSNRLAQGGFYAMT